MSRWGVEATLLVEEIEDITDWSPVKIFLGAAGNVSLSTISEIFVLRTSVLKKDRPIGIIGSDGRNDRSVLLGRTEVTVNRPVGWQPHHPPHFSVGEMLFMNFVTVSVSRFYFLSVPYFCMGGNVISTCFSIVCLPKNQLSSYSAWEHFNITMDIGVTEQTRVPLESWKNKESFYI